MPYFAWKGVTITGDNKRGKSFARSSQLLDDRLFKRDIALISCTAARSWFLTPISHSLITSFFEQLASLLNAGILLPDALALMADHAPNIRLALIIEKVGNDIQQGFTLSTALEKHPAIFDAIMVQLIAVGQEAGKVTASICALVLHLDSVQDFRKKMRSAALMPAISLIFFFAVFILIVFIMLPRLTDMLGTAKDQLPAITNFLLNLSQFLRGWNLVLTIAMSAALIASARFWFKRPAQQRLRDWLSLHIPIVRTMTIDTQIGWFFSACSLLIHNGLSVVPALTIARQTVHNQTLRREIDGIINKIAAGSSVWNAFEQANEAYFLPETASIVQVGEQSGSLDSSFEKVAQRYQSRALSTLTVVSTVIQPLMLIILGLLVALLIIAIYAPLFTISSTIGQP